MASDPKTIASQLVQQLLENEKENEKKEEILTKQEISLCSLSKSYSRLETFI